jgi:hypothetical protein
VHFDHIYLRSETTFLSALCVIRSPSDLDWPRTFLIGVELTDLGNFGRYWGQTKGTRAQGGGRLQENGRDQGSGTHARRTPERHVWRDWHLSGPKPLCPLFVCIRVAPNPSWGLLNSSRMLGCKPLPLPARVCHWVSPCPRMGLSRGGSYRAVPSSETPPLTAEVRTV